MRQKIILFANWGLGKRALETLIEKGFNILSVVTQYDKEKGRKDRFFNSVYNTARKNNIKILSSYKELLDKNLNLDNTLGVSIAYNKIFDSKFIDKLKIINFHPSILPEYRGPSPIEWQLKDMNKFIGVTAHFVNHKIDAGDILTQDKYYINYKNNYSLFLQNFNDFFLKFISRTLNRYFFGDFKLASVSLHCNSANYYPGLSIPEAIKKANLKVIAGFLNRPKIAIFTGNRSEFGILFPFVLELSKKYFVNVFVSGTHLIKPWYTVEEIEDKFHRFNLPAAITKIDLNGITDNYTLSLSKIYMEAVKLIHNKYDYRFSIVLGDRIETLGFSLACFYRKIPIIHINGGDVANVPYFDTNARHAISKIASIHFATNELSKKVLQQLGEEDWRIHTIGNLSYDYDRLGLLTPQKEIARELNIKKDEIIFIFTYHAAHNKNKMQNFNDFVKILKVLIGLNKKIIATFPNNDPGSERIMSCLRKLKDNKNNKIKVIANLGTDKLLSLFKNFRPILVGNSSSALLETSFYCIPAINIGDRQTGRFRGSNVFDCNINKNEIKKCILNIIENYEKIKKQSVNSRYFFGDGDAALNGSHIIDRLILEAKEKILFKKFIVR